MFEIPRVYSSKSNGLPRSASPAKRPTTRSQLDAIHAGFTPSASQIAFAQKVVDAVEASETGGALVDGQSVNKANAKGAERILARARRLGPHRA